jgi:hypothetical protein
MVPGVAPFTGAPLGGQFVICNLMTNAKAGRKVLIWSFYLMYGIVGDYPL